MNTHPTQLPLVKLATAPATNVIACAIAGCDSKLEITEPASPQARYVCRHHDRREHLAALGRVFDSNKDEQDKEVRLQKEQFDKLLRRSTKPVGTSHIHRQGSPTSKGDECVELLLNNLTQTLGDGFSVQTATNYEAPRVECPDWIKSRDLFSFITNRLNPRERQDLLQRKIPLWAALDHVILTEYYLHYRTDEAIYEQYEYCLRQEMQRKQRWTSSVNALKNRRLRLVKEGNAMFGTNSSPEGADEVQEANQNDEAASLVTFAT